MDVDLLRPGTVPISPDTSLWFEFLLEPAQFEKHLTNPHADPTPTELITKLLTLSANEIPLITEPIILNSQKIYSRRCLALKITALKVASHLKWNLEVFEKSLPQSIQATLLNDFLYIASPLYSDINLHTDVNFNELPPQVIYAIFLYHRWVLRGFVSQSLRGKTKQAIETPIEEITEAEAEKSAAILKRLINEPLVLLAPAPSCFVIPTEETDYELVWDEGEKLQSSRVISEILMDVSLYLVNRGKYPEARSSLSACLASGPSVYPNLTGLCIAVGVRPKLYKPSLSQQFHEAIAAKYINIDKVLEKDNALRQIPIVYRQGLELDISSEVANGKLITSRDAVSNVRALNSIRVALDGGVQLRSSSLVPTSLVKAVSLVLPLSDSDQKKLEYYLLHMLSSSEITYARQLAIHLTKLPFLSSARVNSVIGQHNQVDIIPRLRDSDTTPRSKSLELAALERLVLISYSPTEINSALMKLFDAKPTSTWDKLNRNWEIQNSLGNVIMALSAGFTRNYAYILVAKSYELDQIKNYSQAKVLLMNVIDEIGNDETGDKLRQLINQEILLVDINQFHNEWPGKHLDWTGMTERCLDGVSTARSGIREAACLALLNIGAWTPLIQEAPLKSLLTELYVAFAKAALSLGAPQFNNKVPLEAWEKVLPLFLTGMKRRDLTVMKGLNSILEHTALNVLISLLARLHNVLADQPPLDLYAPFTHLWPGTMKNANQYSAKLVSECLMEILEHALVHYPYNVAWLKLMGDIHFANCNYRSALSSYLEAAAVGTDHFSRPLHRPILEDHIIKRMIKSCTQLQCHTQAGVLCQLLEETDYSTAYKCFSDVNPSDASDSYHQSIWDINILEFLISLHAKRGEHHRKQHLVRKIGLLELNANNNDEIKREAENIRKNHFLRAMAAQYL